MTLFIVAVLSIITLIVIPGETANLRQDNDLLGGGYKFQLLNRASQYTATTESIIGGSGRRLKRSGGDGGRGSVMFLTNSEPSKDLPIISTDMDTKSIEASNNREQRHSPYTIIGDDKNSWLDQFSTSTEAKMDKYILSREIPSINDMLRWKLNIRSTYKNSNVMEPIDP